MEYQLLMQWTYVVSPARRITVNLSELVTDDPTGQFLKYRVEVYHDGLHVKGISIEKFHTAMFTFHKTIDVEVKHHVTSV